MLFMEIINNPSEEDIINFLNNNTKNQSTFRYYKKRNIDVIKNHLKTILCVDEKILGYGHLDVENDKIWLGIMVCDECIGRNIGKFIMENLLNNIDCDVYLSVDTLNERAINLYKKYNFSIIEENKINNFYIMKREK